MFLWQREEEKEGFHPGFPRSLRLFDIEWSLSLSGQTHAEPHRASSHPAIPGVTEGLSAVTRNGMTDLCESQMPILLGRPYSVPAEPTFSKASHSPVQAKAWKSSTAAWKWVLEPLRWVIPLRLNCCLNSGSHKLCYSCFIKKQNWWTICLTHYMAETIFQTKGQKPRYHMPWRQDDPSRHGRMCVRASPHGAGRQTLKGGTKFTIPTFLAKLDYREGRKKMT